MEATNSVCMQGIENGGKGKNSIWRYQIEYGRNKLDLIFRCGKVFRDNIGQDDN